MQRLLKAIVVDDERLARLELSKLLAATQVSVVASAEALEPAEALIKRHQPDVVFLDVQLGKHSGFDLLNRVGGFEVIFVTAYEQYAIRAFESHALDYLLKPVHPERLADAILHLGERIETKDAHPQNRDFICVKSGRNIRFVKFGSIVCMRAAGDYSEVLTATGETVFAMMSLKSWEQRLAGQCFARIHRSTIVNLEYVDRVEHSRSCGFRVRVKNQQIGLAMSRRYASRLQQIFRGWRSFDTLTD
jgi:two-component system LytT family response regulator